MAHETQQHSTENKPRTALTSSFWFVIVLVGLFIAAVNFVKVMSNSEEEGTKTEATHEGAAKAEGEKSAEKPAAMQAKPATADTAHAAH
ncbi:MAG: hypothetical protein WCG87_08880 [Bacteroidota bacterium]